MVKIRKYANGIERFLHGQKGQRFFNFAYSIGAAIVIWGALFKILHLPGGSTLLCIGMGTEIAMFILTAFDRPPKEYAWEDVFPVLDSKNPEDRPDFHGGAGGGGVFISGGGAGNGDTTASFQGGGAGGGGVFISGGGNAGGGVHIDGGAVKASAGLPQGITLTEEDTASLHDSIVKMASASEQLSRMAELTDATQQYLAGMQAISEQMVQLKETTQALNEVSAVLLSSYRAITDNSDNISRNSTGYADQMADLNRNIGGLNTIYEIQLKNVSGQLETIDRVNRGLKDIRDMYEKSAHESSRYCEETEKMARYMKQINAVYEKMITAMTINMHNPMMGGAPVNPFAESDSKSE
ncbi:MAG: gliding motility protein GldL [Bacteroides sp.]|nr:gliding motility protein GldL [Bacteroides sp.]